MAEGKARQRRGMSLRLVMILLFLGGLAMSCMVLWATLQMTEGYADVERANREFMSCQNDIYTIQTVANRLNERARNFVSGGSQGDAVLYIRQMTTKKSMESAVSELRACLKDDKALGHLEEAVALNEKIAGIQRHAIRLAIEGYGRDPEKYPELLRDEPLTAAEREMSAEEKRRLAADSLFSSGYSSLRDQEEVRMNLCKDAVIQLMNARLRAYSQRQEQLFLTQRLWVYGLAGALLAVLIFVMVSVIDPIHRFVSDIGGEAPVKCRGASELRFLAESYNRMHRHMEDANARLSYEATHDPLTGMVNRSAFDRLRAENAGRDMALLIVDVDLFKQVNDGYGHDVGDRVLIRVARVLREAFREQDSVCRIGGDEFSVIIGGATSRSEESIRERMKRAAECLNVPMDGMPAITLSAGCAFADRLRPGEDLFKNADRALYRVKQSGRNGCAFHS